MIITIMLIRPVSEGFTIRIFTAATTTIITPMLTGTTQIHGIMGSASIWAITGGELDLDSGMDILITDMAILIMDMVILTTDMDMVVDMVADTTITIIPVITTVMIRTRPITDTVVLLPLPEAVNV